MGGMHAAVAVDCQASCCLFAPRHGCDKQLRTCCKLLCLCARARFNPIWEFNYTIQGTQCDMVFTSVAGHLMELDFTQQHKRWRSCSPLELYNAPVVKAVPDVSASCTTGRCLLCHPVYTINSRAAIEQGSAAAVDTGRSAFRASAAFVHRASSVLQAPTGPEGQLGCIMCVVLLLACSPVQDKNDLKEHLQQLARQCQWLILWLDCDREGENISFEVCKAVYAHCWMVCLQLRSADSSGLQQGN